MYNIDNFEVASGTIRGTGHKVLDKPNQDSFLVCKRKDHIVGVVCDGNSSCEHSEVGARIGAKLICDNISSVIDRFDANTVFSSDTALRHALNIVKTEVIASIDIMAGMMSLYNDDKKSILGDYFVFTSLFFVITENNYVIAGIGDGTYIINNELKPMGDYPDNCPPGIVYMLFPHLDENMHDIAIHEFGNTSDLKNLLIASDGIDDITEKYLQNIPGQNKHVGEIGQFLNNDKYFKNPDAVRRTLTLMNRDIQKIDWNNSTIDRSTGLLHDDTTLIAIRRKL